MREQDFEILTYLQSVWKWKFTVLAIVVVSVLGTAVYSLMVEERFRAEAVISPTSPREASSGLSSAMQQLGGLAGISMPTSAPASEIVNLLKSKTFREKVIVEHELMPILFKDRWDGAAHKWISDEGGGSLSLASLRGFGSRRANGQTHGGTAGDGAPSLWDGLRTMDQIVSIVPMPKENVIIIGVEFNDPVVAAEIAGHIMYTLNEHMSGESRRVADTNRRYLEHQLLSVSDPLIRNKIYSLIAQQVELSMMSAVKENFAFKVLDKPKAPDKRIWPKRWMMVKVSLVVSLFGGVFLAIALDLISKRVRTRQ